ncbi:hypothetical protein [Deinococcus hopiensis]|uniref:hypothetical protein n=1 Tax=Deinococcus hopiensis TaxID=309885 RepID=UPI001FEB0A86|nr:hypothetical protein [Deinococcus hopiensis]
MTLSGAYFPKARVYSTLLVRRNTILIPGGGSGIGQALAQQFHALGNAVITAGR